MALSNAKVSHRGATAATMGRWVRLYLIVRIVAFAGIASAKPCQPDIGDGLSYQHSFLAWMSYVDTLARQHHAIEQNVMYNGVTLTESDAISLLDFYKRTTNFHLSNSEITTILHANAPTRHKIPKSGCAKLVGEYLEITAQHGAEQRQQFLIKIAVYPRRATNTTVFPNVILDVINGNATRNDFIEDVPGEVFYDVVRHDFDYPIYLNALVFGKGQVRAVFPPRPKYSLDLKTKIAETITVRRSAHFGTSAAASPTVCVDADPGAALVPNTAKLTRIGDGLEWRTRTSAQIWEYSTKRICAAVESQGASCGSESCFHEVKGQLSVIQAAINARK